MNQESIERMNELIDILNDANYNYYVKDNPTITDQEFDKYLRELEMIEKSILIGKEKIHQHYTLVGK